MSAPEKASKRTDGEIVKRLAKELSPFKVLFAIAALLYIPVTAVQLAQPLFIGRAVDEGYRKNDLHAVALWAGLYVSFVVLRSVFDVTQLYLMQRMGQLAIRGIRSRLFAKIQRLPMSYFDKTPLGRVMTRVTNDTESLGELFSSGAVSIVGDLLFLVGTLITST